MTANIDQSYQERILKVLIYIQNNLDADLSLENLAEIAHFSPYHFHRIFTAHTGESIKSYIRRLRLERARRDLMYTEKAIIRIAERAGYDTQQSFHRAFKEAFNETPKAYRKKFKTELETLANQTLSTPTLNAAKTIAPKTVKIVTIEPIPVIFVRQIGSYEKIIETWLQLASAVSLDKIFSSDTQKIGIAYDSPDITPTEKLRYDACISTSGLEHIATKGKLGKQTIHGGKYAVITHHGSLQTIEKTYEYLFGIWLPQSGYEPADYPNFMLHRTLPMQTQEELLETDIYLPLR